jgi:hypothetical protein
VVGCNRRWARRNSIFSILIDNRLVWLSHGENTSSILVGVTSYFNDLVAIYADFKRIWPESGRNSSSDFDGYSRTVASVTHPGCRTTESHGRCGSRNACKQSRRALESRRRPIRPAALRPPAVIQASERCFYKRTFVRNRSHGRTPSPFCKLHQPWCSDSIPKPDPEFGGVIAGLVLCSGHRTVSMILATDHEDPSQ